ncbi:hypothetical protein HELRODRAFT_66479 [Helobdella robusta]|uniref:WD repeat-containing protein 70 n=1 Tax=Helobdella robusta TaxID=6412 RepID=T1FYL8_HELRO|nr:hypothetical protein HELRODRAFT_66479 [Helobdella robusta]ESN99028.1 hypothetical protein HELRODRAFT_66479 [Helobdella robusta]
MEDIKKNSQKKARNFDFLEMFDKARITAMEMGSENIAKMKKVEEEMEKSDDCLVKEFDCSDNRTNVSTYPRDENKFETKTDKDSKIGREDDVGDKNEDEEGIIGPPLPASLSSKFTTSDKSCVNDEDDEDDDDEEEKEDRLPLDNKLVLNHGKKPISSLHVDASGARLVVGSYDYSIKFWDFAGMDSSLRPFRTINPCEGHIIRDLKFSSNGDMVLVISGSAQAKVLDRDGHEIMECIKGDQYIIDQSNTKGHTAMLNAGSWNPRMKEEFMTCSDDGTLRLWDVSYLKKQKTVIKPKSLQGKKVVTTTCSYSRDGKLVAAACQDGSIQMWEHGKLYVNVILKNMTAHGSGNDISSISFSYDNNFLASRSTDDTLKLWDLRHFKKAVFEVTSLYNLFPMTDCCFSPNDNLIATGVSAEKGGSAVNGTGGKLVFYDKNTCQKFNEFSVSDSSVIRCLWHPRLNQIICSTASGDVNVFYGDKSHRGAKLSLEKKSKTYKSDEAVGLDPYIITPYSLPLFKTPRPTTSKKAAEKDRKDPVKSRRPDLPVNGPGEGGRVGAHGATLSQYIIKNLVLRKPDERDKDPRSAILRHAKEAAEHPFWITPAYQKTQPKPVFQKFTTEEDNDSSDELAPVYKKLKTKEK